MVVVAAHFLFNAQMMQQFARHTAVFNRDYVCGPQKVDRPL
jgi:hypothetical protein